MPKFSNRNKRNRARLVNNLATKPKITIEPSKCRNILCLNCISGRVVERRKELNKATREWKGLVMVTLTVDPKLFEIPEAAFNELKARKLSRFIRENLSDTFFYWTEFQENGMPHWNVVVDSVKPVLIKRMAKKWKHGISHVDITKKYSRKHCINYAVKVPDHPFPGWFIKTDRQRRLFGSSRELISRSEVRNRRENVKRSGEPKKAVCERLVKCGTQRVLFSTDKDGMKHQICRLSVAQGMEFDKLEGVFQQIQFLRERFDDEMASRYGDLMGPVPCESGFTYSEIRQIGDSLISHLIAKAAA